MSKQKLAALRLQKQQRSLDQQPVPHLLVTRKGLLSFHFCIYGLDGVYQGGVYHGVLQLDSDYPFAPPKLLFYTPSGRFQTNKPICTTFTNYHKQSWTAGWTVRTMLTATLSFMTSQQIGVGGLSDGYVTRRSYAQKSWRWNMKSQLFRQLFQTKLRQHPQLKNRFLSESSSNTQEQKNPQIQATSQNSLYFMYLALIVLLFMWALIKSS